MLLGSVGARDDPVIGRTADAVALVESARCSIPSAEQRRRHAVPPRDRHRRSGTPLRARRRDPRSPREVSRRRGHAHHHRRRLDQRRRILGVAEHARACAACRCCISSRTTATRSPRRSEVQTPGGDFSRVVEHFPGLRGIPLRRHRLRRRATARCGTRWRTCVSARDLRSCTPQVVRPLLAFALRRREAVQDARGA